MDRKWRAELTALGSAAILAAATLACSGAHEREPAVEPKPGAPAETSPPYAKPSWVLGFHWNDAADTVRVLRILRPDQRVRATVTLTGADTLQGYTLTFRMQPTGGAGSTAWTFAEHGGCEPATWAATAERDPRASAPWRNKLLITDLRRDQDGSMWIAVGATFDSVALDPDSTYSLCHLDFDPPRAKPGRSCAGWDGPAQIYIETAKVLRMRVEQSTNELGKTLRAELAGR